MTIRPATPADIAEVEALLADAGLPLAGAARAFRTGVVAVLADRLVAAAAIEPYGDSALLRSVVVAPAHRGTGVGREVVAEAEDTAVAAGATDLYLLTETAASWFTSLGYRTIDRSAVPPAIGASVEFTQACATTAIAMQRDLRGAPRVRIDHPA